MEEGRRQEGREGGTRARGKEKAQVMTVHPPLKV
jgi:hypothetical protein